MSELYIGGALFVLIVLGLASAVLAVRALVFPERPCALTLNGRRTLKARTHQKLLPVLTDAGVLLPATCGGRGTCGLCRVRILSEHGEPSPAELARIGVAAAREGTRLACQVVLRGDLALEVPESVLGARSFECTLRSNRQLSPFIAELTLELPEGEALELRAGAFVEITAPPYRLPFSELRIAEPYVALWQRLGLYELTASSEQPVKRAYSLANRPADAGVLVLNVRVALPPPGTDFPPGVVSSYLFGLSPGTRVEVSGPFGNFAVRPGDAELVFIGGGAGMAPLRAMIFEQLEREHTKRAMSFWYGARSKAEIFYREELEALQAAHPSFRFTIALSEPKPEDAWDGPTGFIHRVVHEQLLRDHPAPQACEFYLCGPPLMTQAVLAMLDGLGVPKDHIFVDDFGE